MQGIGGSEASAVFSLGWGCARRLAYDKREIKPDYPRDENLLMSLGNLMEPWFADRYVEITGRTVGSAAAYSHPVHPELRVNVDRDIAPVAGHDGVGVLEIKSQGRGAYAKTKVDGLSEDYLLQLQWALMVTERSWGSFAIGCRDSGELMHWDVERDDSIIDEMLIAGPALWALIKSNAPLPEPLEIDDRRCSDCQWRQQCQGNALIRSTGSDGLPVAEDIRPLLAEYDRINERFSERLSDGSRGTSDQLRLEEIKNLLRAALGDRDAVAVPQFGEKDRKIYYRSQAGRLSWKVDDLIKVYEKMREAVRLTVDTETGMKEFNDCFPPATFFERRGVPFKSLRVF